MYFFKLLPYTAVNFKDLSLLDETGLMSTKLTVAVGSLFVALHVQSKQPAYIFYVSLKNLPWGKLNFRASFLIYQ